MNTDTLAQRIARFAINLKFEDLDAPTVHEVKRRIIDSIGCAYGSYHAEPCTVARKVASTLSSQRGATLIGTRHKAPTDWAAFANGCLVRYLDYNDTYLSKEPAHPSDNIPAALAVAEAHGASGRELITAIVIAYEIQCRLCDASSIRARGWDHVTYGTFSSAMAAARLMKLDEERARHAVNIAGVASAALRQSRVGELSHWKGVAFANAARHGVYAAMLAEAGMTGPAPIFEGEKGFEKLVSGSLSEIAGPFGLGGQVKPADGFMMLKTSIKFWPAEYHSQSAIDVALKLRPQIKSADEIESVIIDSHDAAVDIIGSEPEKWRPQSRETADHSLPYIVAAALMDGEITPKQFARERYTEAKLLDLTSRVQVRRHAEISALYPRGVGNLITIHLRGGRTLAQRIDYPRGNAHNRMTDDEVLTKYSLMASPLVGADRARQIADAIWQLDRAPGINDIIRLLETS